MMRRLLLLVAILALAAGPALAANSASKDGAPFIGTPGAENVKSSVRDLFEYNTAGTIDFVPDMGGSATGWAEWTITFVTNTSGQDLCLTELSWPCAGPATGAYGWLVWLNQATLPGPASSAQYYGAFTPVDPNPATFPPTVYTYIDVSSAAIPWAAGSTLCFGFDNTGMQGMTAYNGVDTYGWYLGAWDADGPYGRTCVMQLKADVGCGTPTERSTWGAIKALFQ
jgi:hypothetical protein